MTTIRAERDGFGHRALWLLALFGLELGLLAVLYQFGAEIECQNTAAEGLCRGLRSLVARAMGVGVAAAVLIWARPRLARRMRAGLADAHGGRTAILIHGLGLALLLAPLLLAGGADMSPVFLTLMPFWVVGAVLAAVGGMLWLAPWAAWRRIVGADTVAVLAAVACGLVLPDLADLLLPLWYGWPWLTRLTFDAVGALLLMSGAVVHVDAPGLIIGVGGFFVHIAQQCSGVEGLALVTGFTALYAALMWREIRVLRYLLVVLPLGLMLSWSLNVVRIAALIIVGDRISPDLAVNGFHSYAGWFFFTLLALGLMALVHATPWLHREPAGSAMRGGAGALRADVLAARIVPFIVFMLAAILVAALFPRPELGYPVIAVALAVALMVFAPALRQIDWAPHWLPLLAGAVVGGGWLLAASGGDALPLAGIVGRLAPVVVVGWVVARVIGTVVLVPMVEELFFRGYVLIRLDRGGMGWRIAALAISSLLFGLMHSRLVVAGLAGLVFGLLLLWRRRPADAVWAHVVANAVVAGAALMADDWSLI